jgi:hypothetical protein
LRDSSAVFNHRFDQASFHVSWPTNSFNTWWDNQKEFFPSLHLFAFDTFAIPAMSAECERVFSSTKKLLTPERSRLQPDIIEASECLKNWWDRGLIQQLEDE